MFRHGDANLQRVSKHSEDSAELVINIISEKVVFLVEFEDIVELHFWGTL